MIRLFLTFCNCEMTHSRSELLERSAKTSRQALARGRMGPVVVVVVGGGVVKEVEKHNITFRPLVLTHMGSHTIKRAVKIMIMNQQANPGSCPGPLGTHGSATRKHKAPLSVSTWTLAPSGASLRRRSPISVAKALDQHPALAMPRDRDGTCWRRRSGKGTAPPAPSHKPQERTTLRHAWLTPRAAS